MLYEVEVETLMRYRRGNDGQLFFIEGEERVELYFQTTALCMHATFTREPVQDDSFDPYTIWKSINLADAVPIKAVKQALTEVRIT